MKSIEQQPNIPEQPEYIDFSDVPDGISIKEQELEEGQAIQIINTPDKKLYLATHPKNTMKIYGQSKDFFELRNYLNKKGLEIEH